jgi:hypothetical protein
MTSLKGALLMYADRNDNGVVMRRDNSECTENKTSQRIKYNIHTEGLTSQLSRDMGIVRIGKSLIQHLAKSLGIKCRLNEGWCHLKCPDKFALQSCHVQEALCLISEWNRLPRWS